MGKIKEKTVKLFFAIIIALFFNCFALVSAAENLSQPIVSAGDEHTIALTSSGDLYAWGDNYYGQIGDGTNISRYSPVKVLSNVKTAVAGRNYNLAIKNNSS